MTGALAGVRVVDFGQYVAGPLAAMLLADQGADVIRVDPPGGPRWQVDGSATWNRGKRSIVLDLKTDPGRRIAQELVAAADVVVENFRPGVMDRLGVGPESSSAANPRLVYCSLPGFASDDPRAACPAWEGVIGAATGLYLRKAQTGLTDVRPGIAPDRPVYSPLPVASVFGAFAGAAAVVMALVARERDGLGQHVEVPLFDATFVAATEPGFEYHVSASGRQYECADGRWIYLHATNRRFMTQMLVAAGGPEWDDDGVVDAILHPDSTTDPAKARYVVDRLAGLFRTRSSGEWEEAISAAGTPAAVCRSSAEWLLHPHVRAAGMVVEVDDPVYGPMVQPGVAVRLSETPGAVRGPAPVPDQHHDEILTELQGLARTKTPPASLRPEVSEPPLAGTRMLDLGVVRAGPVSGRTLAEFGAEVVKVDDPQGRKLIKSASRGKRSIYLDLRHEAGHEVLGRLVERCDVFMQNFRKGKADLLGFAEADVRKRRPDVVYVYMNTYGSEGPFADRPGYEFQAQAATGMQERFGGSGPPVKEPFLINDHGTGVLGAFGAGLALLHRSRTGVGQRVEVALASTSMLLQSVFMNDYPGKVWDQPRGQNVLGSGHLHRMYRAADGWLFVAAPGASASSLDEVQGLSGIAEVPDSQVGMFLEARLASATVDEWVARLGSAGVGAHRVCTVGEAMDDPWVLQHGLRLVRDHPDGGIADTIGPVVRMARTPVKPGRVLRPSRDAPEILADIGMEDRLDDLVAADTVRIETPGAPRR